MTEPVEEFYSRNAERYDRTHSVNDWSDEFRENISKFCELLEGNVLDAGCGPGVVSDFLSKKGFEVIGIDIAEGMIEYARENKEGTFLRMEISDLDFEEEKFDGIWCGSTIFFQKKEKMEETLAGFQKVLQENGVLYIDFKEGNGRYTKQKWDGEVIEYRVSESEAREMIQRNGFEILKFIEWGNSKDSNYLEFICQKN